MTHTDNPLLQRWETPYQLPPFDRVHEADFRPGFDVVEVVMVVD